MTTHEMLLKAKETAVFAANMSTKSKNDALFAMADALEQNLSEILAENQADLADAKGKISDVMLDRLLLNEMRIHAMAEGIREVVKLPDPVGKILSEINRPNGLKIEKVSVPLGVIGIIYESRPNVTSDAAALCLKSGNVSVLRGGKEAFRTASAILRAMRKGLLKLGLPETLINMPEDPSRESANELMNAVGLVDLLIPRGGAGLIKACVDHAKVPCIQTGTGICHLFVDESADFDTALSVIENAKASRPSVCNALEVCLVHKNAASKFLPMLQKRLVDERLSKGLKPIELRLDKRAAALISGVPMGDNDFDTEFLDYVMAVGIVDNLEGAIAHIAKHSTHHSESILTNNMENATNFANSVDSAAVYINASTRFTDGGEFGLGCEIGISTQKLHARGPMGLCELTTYKYVVRGNGQIR